MPFDFGVKLVTEEKAAPDAGGDWRSPGGSNSYRSSGSPQPSVGQIILFIRK